MRLYEPEDSMANLRCLISRAMDPFKPGEILVGRNTFGISVFYTVEVQRLPGHPAVLYPDFSLSQDEVVHDLMRQMFNHFRNRQVEPDDHIQLGED